MNNYDCSLQFRMACSVTVLHIRIQLNIYWWLWIKSSSLHSLKLNQFSRTWGSSSPIANIPPKKHKTKHWVHLDCIKIFNHKLYLSIESFKYLRVFFVFTLFLITVEHLFNIVFSSGKNSTKFLNFHLYLVRKNT